MDMARIKAVRMKIPMKISPKRSDPCWLKFIWSSPCWILSISYPRKFDNPELGWKPDLEGSEIGLRLRFSIIIIDKNHKKYTDYFPPLPFDECHFMLSGLHFLSPLSPLLKFRSSPWFVRKREGFYSNHEQALAAWRFPSSFWGRSEFRKWHPSCWSPCIIFDRSFSSATHFHFNPVKMKKRPGPCREMSNFKGYEKYPCAIRIFCKRNAWEGNGRTIF